MKILITFVCILAFLSVTLALTINFEQVPVNSEYCESSDPSIGKVKVDEKRSAPGCVGITCTPGRIEIMRCEDEVPKSCTNMKPGDRSKPYPDCCHLIACP